MFLALLLLPARSAESFQADPDDAVELSPVRVIGEPDAAQHAQDVVRGDIEAEFAAGLRGWTTGSAVA